MRAQQSVEIRQRLVHQQHGRVADDRPRHRDALPLAAGQRVDAAVEQRARARARPAARPTAASATERRTFAIRSGKRMFSRAVMCGYSA